MANTYKPIASVSASSGTVVSFTSIPQTYTHLVVYGAMGSSYGANVGTINFTVNGLTSLAYGRNYLTYDNSAISASSADGDAAANMGGMQAGSSSGANHTGFFVLYIYNYATSLTTKTMTWQGGVSTASGAGNTAFGSNYSGFGAAITSIQFNAITGTISAGTQFTLYGITAA